MEKFMHDKSCQKNNTKDIEIGIEEIRWKYERRSKV